MKFEIMGINDPEVIKRILDECKTIAVVGLSSNPIRPELSASRGICNNAVTASSRSIRMKPKSLGEKAYASLADVPEKFDLVDIFRRSEEAGEHVDEAIRLGARAVWLQEDVIDEDAAARALEAGLMVVMDRCILKEHMRRLILSEPSWTKKAKRINSSRKSSLFPV